MVVDFHKTYLTLGESEGERQKAYAEYVLGTVPEYEIKLIRDALQRGQLTGSYRFRAEIEKKLGIRLSNSLIEGQDGLKKSDLNKWGRLIFQKINLSPFL